MFPYRFLDAKEEIARFVQREAKERGVQGPQHREVLYNMYIGDWLDLDTLTQFLRMMELRYGMDWPSFVCYTFQHDEVNTFYVADFAKTIHGMYFYGNVLDHHDLRGVIYKERHPSLMSDLTVNLTIIRLIG